MQVKAQCEAVGQCDMGGFTRLLHSGAPDDLMDEIPTFVANPLPDEGNKGYASSCTTPLSFSFVLDYAVHYMLRTDVNLEWVDDSNHWQCKQHKWQMQATTSCMI